mgnify:FL=1
MTLVFSRDFVIFADYFQFYLQDERSGGINGDSWNKDSTDRMLAVENDAFAVGTVRNMNVPVTVELHNREPTIIQVADQILECSMRVPSGKIVIAGCTDYFPDASRIETAPGAYRVRVSFFGLEDISDDRLEGKDRYLVQLWPENFTSVSIVKERAVRKVAG